LDDAANLLANFSSVPQRDIVVIWSCPHAQ
jgi:hypothetical protein